MKKISLLLCLCITLTRYCWGGDPSCDLFFCYPQGFQIGLGGSYNSISLSQSMNATGVSEVFTSGIVVASGEAGGDIVPFRETKSTFSPKGEIGYFHHFCNSPWFLGGKFAYQYLGLTFSNGPIESPLSSEFTTILGTDIFFGNTILQSSQTQVNHELILMPFIGRSLNNTHFYLGAGAVAFRANFFQYNFIGFTDINAVPSAIVGDPANFTNSLWMWGAGGEIGIAHYFNPRWSVNFSYSYLATGKYKFSDSELFTSSTISGDAVFTTFGTAFIEAKPKITAQAFSLTMNFMF